MPKCPGRGCVELSGGTYAYAHGRTVWGLDPLLPSQFALISITLSGRLHRYEGIRLGTIRTDERGRMVLTDHVGPINAVRPQTRQLDGRLILRRKCRSGTLRLVLIYGGEELDIVDLSPDGIMRAGGFDPRCPTAHSMLTCNGNWVICEEEVAA